MIKGYLASNFFDLGGYEVTDRIANIIEKYGVDLYVPQRNDEINDKESDILFLYYDGEDAGVMSELGYFASMLENTSKKGLIVGIYTDCRQNGKGDGHHYINLFSKGGIEKHGVLICITKWEDRWQQIEDGLKKAIKEFKLDNRKPY